MGADAGVSFVGGPGPTTGSRCVWCPTGGAVGASAASWSNRRGLARVGCASAAVGHAREDQRTRRRCRVGRVRERGAHRRCVRVAVGGVDRARTIDHRRERPHLFGRDQRLLGARREHADRRVRVERQCARHGLDQHERERIEVRAAVEMHTLGLFRATRSERCRRPRRRARSSSLPRARGRVRSRRPERCRVRRTTGSRA